MPRLPLLKLAALCVLAAMPLTANAQRLGATVRAGTDGIGGALTARLIPVLNARVQLGMFSYGADGTEPVDYDAESIDMQWTADARMFTVSALLDLHPFANAFRLSGGAYYNGVQGDGSVRSLDDITVSQGSSSYTLTKEDIGQLEMTISYPAVAPYAGIGFGNAASSRVGFSLDLGAMYMGEPQVELRGTGAIAPSANAANAASIQQSIEDAQFLPVVSFGVSARLF